MDSVGIGPRRRFGAAPIAIKPLALESTLLCQPRVPDAACNRNRMPTEVNIITRHFLVMSCRISDVFRPTLPLALPCRAGRLGNQDPAPFPGPRVATRTREAEEAMSIFDALGRLWRRDAVHYVLARIPPDHQDEQVTETVVLAEQHYFRIWVSEMFLKHDGRLFRDYVPVVHSAVTLRFGERPAQELPYVAGPQQLGLESSVGKGVQVNHPLTNLLPFRGGVVGLAAALLAYKEKDYFNGFMEVLSDVSGLLNVGQLSTTLKVVDVAVDGIQNMLGGGDKDLHLLYYQGFGGSDSSGGASLKSGFTAVIKANANSFDEKQLWVKDKRLHFGKTLEEARPLEGYDYMLLRTEATERRDDFLSFDSLGKLLKDAIREGHRDKPAGDAIIQTVKVIVWESPDLTNTDRLVVAKAVQKVYEDALGSAPAALEPESPVLGGSARPIAELKALSRVAKEMKPPPGSAGFLRSSERPPLLEFMRAVD